jgi:hypothetical protein
VCQPGNPSMKTLSFLTHHKIFDNAARDLFRLGHAGLPTRGGRTYRGRCGKHPVRDLIASK